MDLQDDEFMRVQQDIQNARKQHLKSVCQQYQSEPPDPMSIIHTSADMLVDEKHKIVMCCTAKVAGKSWKRVFNVLTGLSNSTMIHKGFETVNIARKIRRLKSYKPEELKNIFENYTFFMFARNPLTRILSAYNNLLAPNCTMALDRKECPLRKIGYSIIKANRPWSLAAKNASSEYYDLTFLDFVRYLAYRKPDVSQGNNHWIENYRFCRPCDVPYDIIGNFETLMEDAKYILKLTNVDKIVSFPGTETDSTFSSAPKKFWSFYKQIPLGDIAKLVERYKLDFLLFNYSYPTNDSLSQWFRLE